MIATGLVSDDNALLAAVANGDENALNALMQTHQGALYHFVLRYTCDETIAHETVHDTFVRVWFKASSFTPKTGAAAKTWIYAIALNIIRDRERSQLRKFRIFASFGADDEKAQAGSSENQNTTYVTPDAETEKKERMASLQKSIQRLPEKLRLPLVMCTLEGMPQIEAAAILMTSPKSVELRIRRAKEKLRKWMMKDA